MNTDGKMSYKDFIFPVNPSLIKISHTRKTTQQKIPYENNIVSDMGKNCRVIRGEGEFYGENCISTFLRLRSIFENGGGGMLYIPGEKPVYAIFSSLDIIAEDIEGVGKYSFEFTESFEKAVSTDDVSCIADGKSSLWDIAYKYDKSVENLIELNPSVRRPDSIIESGERVTLC